MTDTRFSSREIKKQARVTLTGRYGSAVSLTISFSLFSYALNMLLAWSGLASSSRGGLVAYIALYIIILLLTALLETGLIRFLYQMSRRDTMNVAGLFYAFRAQPDVFIIIYAVRYALMFVCFVPAIIVYYNTPVITDLSAVPDGFWFGTVLSAVLALVGLIPAAYFALRLSFITYVLLDEPLLSARETLSKGSDLMRGNYRKVLRLWLGFIPYALLCVGSLGIGYYWVKPYFHTAMGQMYLEITGKAPQTDSGQQQYGYSDSYAG